MAAPPAEPIRWRDAWMACRDGTRLISRIWSPAGEGPWPALLMRQPYGRAIASTVVYAHPSWYAEQGFLVVVQDVRGRGDSEGEFGGFGQEAADGSDCLHWLRRLPECNGLVGCYGFSYQGLSQLTWADPEELPDCLAPAMTGLDERQHWASSGGAHWWALSLAWGLQLAAQGCQRRGEEESWSRLRRSLEQGSFTEEGLGLLERHDPDGMVLQWLRRNPADSDAWRSHPIPAALLRRPMLLIGGWQDPHLQGVLQLWHRARAAGGDPWLRIGAWSHLSWAGALDAMQAAFFRRHLQAGAAEPHLHPKTALQDCRTAVWLTPEPQPPGDPSRQSWRLERQGQLLPLELPPEPPNDAHATGSNWICVVHDPWRPVPGRGGHLGLDAGLCDRSDLDARQDVACFTSAPQSVPVALQGQPLLNLTAFADQPGFDLCVALSAVAPDGQEVRQLSTGVERFLGDHCLQPQRRRVLLQPLWCELQPGERLRLSIAGAAWPQIAVNPGTGELPMGGPRSRHRIVTLTLGLDGSSLQLDRLTTAAARADWADPDPSS